MDTDPPPDPRTGPRTGPHADLAGRRAVVTGAASGIGLACARALAAAGADVLAVDRDGEGLSALAAQTGARTAVVDLLDLDAAGQIGEGADVVVNNAGVQHVAPLHEFPPERFSTILTLMLEAPFRTVRAALPGMYAQGWGRVVSISSVHGHRASEYKAAYVAAKHGLEGLSKVIALEGAPHGVTSNCISPGYVRTPLVEGQVADQARVHGIAESEVVARVMLERSPVKRLVEPEEVAAAALFLCGPASASVTGTSLVLDGGWTAR
ncbi:3-hydroxybutyrate dehydrogenase [Quadrisphaera sp. DSM 44207]|uniref:3-hydroxybutyrate dehydrogenase n=1 Tax=Quadrisphaera sp. DSM 44207 TaxID=1881057 RepID=UPI00159FDDCA|nr:3-hydroxybutyrate dehydrogenase [Quadrisphaera sp. DSM 44207]